MARRTATASGCSGGKASAWAITRRQRRQVVGVDAGCLTHRITIVAQVAAHRPADHAFDLLTPALLTQGPAHPRDLLIPAPAHGTRCRSARDDARSIAMAVSSPGTSGASGPVGVQHRGLAVVDRRSRRPSTAPHRPSPDPTSSPSASYTAISTSRTGSGSATRITVPNSHAAADQPLRRADQFVPVPVVDAELAGAVLPRHRADRGIDAEIAQRAGQQLAE